MTLTESLDVDGFGTAQIPIPASPTDDFGRFALVEFSIVSGCETLWEVGRDGDRDSLPPCGEEETGGYGGEGWSDLWAGAKVDLVGDARGREVVWVEPALRRDRKWGLGGRVEREVEVIWWGVEGGITMREENVWQDKGDELFPVLDRLVE